MKTDPSVIESLGSQSLIFFQLNVATSVKSILFFICKNRRSILDISLSNFERFGSVPFDLERGVLLVSRGELHIFFQCALDIVSPYMVPADHCTDELPVISHTADGPEKLYLMPRTRILTSEPTVTACTSDFPVKFRVNDRLSICQNGQRLGLAPCNSTQSVDPREGLEKARLRSLSKSEFQQGKTDLLSDMVRVIRDFITKINYHKSLDAAITYNSRLCHDKIFCPEAFLTSKVKRRELQRQSVNLIEFLIDSAFYQIMDIVTTLWAGYAIFTGILSYLLRIKATCNKKNQRFTCCQLFFSLFLDLEGAVNPLSLSKIALKRLYREMSSEIASLKMTNDNLLSVNQGLIIRVSLLEQQMESLTSNKRDKKSYLSLYSVPKRPGRKSKLTKGILRKTKGKKYVRFSDGDPSIEDLSVHPPAPEELSTAGDEHLLNHFPPPPTQSELQADIEKDYTGNESTGDEDDCLLNHTPSRSSGAAVGSSQQNSRIPSFRPRLIKERTSEESLEVFEEFNHVMMRPGEKRKQKAPQPPARSTPVSSRSASPATLDARGWESQALSPATSGGPISLSSFANSKYQV